MENKLLFEKKLESKVIDMIVRDFVTIELENGSKIEISGYHEQDCCEHVYADFSALKYHIEEVKNLGAVKIYVKAVSGMGFLLCFGDSSDSGFVKVFVACYDYQNGYYSSNLSLVVKIGENETKIDISDLVESHEV